MARSYRYSWFGRFVILLALVIVLILGRGIYVAAHWMFGSDTTVSEEHIVVVVLSIKDDKRRKQAESELAVLGNAIRIGDAWGWLMSTRHTGREIQDALKPVEYDEDNVFIQEVTKANSGWLNKDTWTWINARTN